jgi:hypothetical protein
MKITWHYWFLLGSFLVLAGVGLAIQSGNGYFVSSFTVAGLIMAHFSGRKADREDK